MTTNKYWQTSYGARCKPDFSCPHSSSKLSCISLIEKFKVKLKWNCWFCMRNALCVGLTVIPPLNFSTSKDKGSPNKDAVVKRRFDWWTSIDSKLALTKLWAVGETLIVLTSESTAKITVVVFDPTEVSKDIISTCHKKTLRWELEEIATKLTSTKKEKQKKDCREYFCLSNIYFIKNIIFKLQDIIFQEPVWFIKHEPSYYVITWKKVQYKKKLLHKNEKRILSKFEAWQNGRLKWSKCFSPTRGYVLTPYTFPCQW